MREADGTTSCTPILCIFSYCNCLCVLFEIVGPTFDAYMMDNGFEIN